MSLRCSAADAVENGKRFQLLTALHAKLIRLLRVLRVGEAVLLMIFLVLAFLRT